MTDRTRLRKIANTYYNMGLERASLNDLTGAALYLKKALCFDKYCKDARNLLGLIYYELGEDASALIQWVVSLNLNPGDNLADIYLEEVQRKPGALDMASLKAKRFNQALELAQTGGDDFAVIELEKIVRDYPKFTKAQMLLGTLNAKNGDFVKAGKAIMEVLKVDRNNPQALILMDEIKHNTGRAEIEQKKLENAFSHRQMVDDDVILPKIRKEASAEQIVLFIVLGIAIGLLSFYLIILPSVRKKYANKFNSQIIENSQELSELNGKYSDIKEKYDALSANYNSTKQKLDAFEEENAGFTTLYSKLNRLIFEYESGNVEKAARDYLEIDKNKVNVEPLTGLYTQLDRYIRNDGFDKIVSMGTDHWNADKKAEAEGYYDLALKIKPDDPETLYLKARLLQSQDRITEANAIFDIIVGEHPESPYADKAVTARGY